MAVDEVLLESAVHSRLCTVRWYQWDRPTLSLGYFQSPSDIAGNAQFSNLPVIRRVSGGGAIVHHHELTYSCTIPAGHPLSREPRQLYLSVHERIIEVLASFGFTARIRGTTRTADAPEFLCFGRGDDFDVVIGNDKVLGSAQRRRKGAILQHGSLILARSEYAPEFPGLSDVAGREVSAADLLTTMPEAVAALFATSRRRTSLSPRECQQVEVLATRNESR